MAYVKLTMSATAGLADEHCTGCERAFERGEQMHAVVYDDGEPAGWFCGICIDKWPKKKGA